MPADLSIVSQSGYVTIQTETGTQTYKLASFWDRLLARLLDGLIIIIPSSFGPLVAGWLYWSLMQSGSKQATVGQSALNIQIISLNGLPVDFGQATGRFFANLLNILTLFIGYLLFFFNPKRQCLHDQLAGTVVVKTGLIMPPQENFHFNTNS